MSSVKQRKAALALLKSQAQRGDIVRVKYGFNAAYQKAQHSKRLPDVREGQKARIMSFAAYGAFIFNVNGCTFVHNVEWLTVKDK